MTEVRWNLGAWPKTIGKPKEYFDRRGCVLDCRGPLSIEESSVWGFGVTVLTRSHDIASGAVGAVIDYPVAVESAAWIGSGALLAGCKIGRAAVVAAGTVVRGQDVAPGVMVAGNPARVIARWDGAAWAYLPAAECGYARCLE